jgi:hypothetical protein
MTEPRDGTAMTDELDELRERADLRALGDALLQRGEAAVERGAWADAQRDFDEAAHVAALLGDHELAARARRGAALACRADGRLATRFTL